MVRGTKELVNIKYEYSIGCVLNATETDAKIPILLLQQAYNAPGLLQSTASPSNLTAPHTQSATEPGGKLQIRRIGDGQRYCRRAEG